MKDVQHLLAVAKVGLMSGKGTLVRFFAICLLFGIAAYEVVSFAFVLRAGCLGCNDVYAWREIASGASVSHVI